MGEPPTAFVIRQVYEDHGDATRPASVSLYLESLGREPQPPVWRRPAQVVNFDEELPRIFEQRRALEERGHWADTAAMVKRALMHRLLLLPQLTAAEVWTRRMKMHGEPCPLTEDEAAEWRSARQRNGSQLFGSG